VNPTTAIYSVSMYTESFEGSAIPNADWQVHNISPGGNTWVQTSSAAVTGSKSVMISNLSTADTYVDELVGPSINMTSITGSSLAMTFKTAYAQRTSTNTDKIQVYVSSNCGQTWSLRKTISGTTLSTGGVVTGTFTPTASQWATQTVNLAGYAGQPDLFFMFRFTSNGGNNIYIDDINILGTVGIEELASSIDFNIFPNPAEENSVISFELTGKKNLDIAVMDVLGRKISTIYSGDLASGEYQFPVANGTSLSSGIYFVKVTMDGKSFTKKLIVK
jgi:hypothetical protein